MISKAALKAYTDQTAQTMTIASATPEQEVAREIAVLLGHGASVQAVVDELTQSMKYEECKQRLAAYRQAIQFIKEPAPVIQRPAEIKTVSFEMGGKQYRTVSSWSLLD